VPAVDKSVQMRQAHQHIVDSEIHPHQVICRTSCTTSCTGFRADLIRADSSHARKASMQPVAVARDLRGMICGAACSRAAVAADHKHSDSSTVESL
jgi:hypothetical protein